MLRSFAISGPEELTDTNAKTEGMELRDAGFEPLASSLNVRLNEQVYQAALNYVDNTEGTISSSPEAEIFIFREQIAKALDDEKIDFQFAYSPKDVIELRFGVVRMCIVALPRDRDSAIDRIESLKKMVVPVIVLSQKATDLEVESASLAVLVHWEPYMGSEALGKIVESVRTRIAITK